MLMQDWTGRTATFPVVRLEIGLRDLVTDEISWIPCEDEPVDYVKSVVRDNSRKLSYVGTVQCMGHEFLLSDGQYEDCDEYDFVITRLRIYPNDLRELQKLVDDRNIWESQ